MPVPSKGQRTRHGRKSRPVGKEKFAQFAKPIAYSARGRRRAGGHQRNLLGVKLSEEEKWPSLDVILASPATSLDSAALRHFSKFSAEETDQRGLQAELGGLYWASRDPEGNWQLALVS